MAKRIELFWNGDYHPRISHVLEWARIPSLKIRVLVLVSYLTETLDLTVLWLFRHTTALSTQCDLCKLLLTPTDRVGVGRIFESVRLFVCLFVRSITQK